MLSPVHCTSLQSGTNCVISSKPEIYFPVYSSPSEHQAALSAAASEIYGAALSRALSRSHSDQTVQGVKSDGPTAEGEPAGTVM